MSLMEIAIIKQEAEIEILNREIEEAQNCCLLEREKILKSRRNKLVKQIKIVMKMGL